MSMFKRYVTVVNTPIGYLWTERGTYYKTLRGLHIAIKREDKKTVKNHKAVATILEIRG